MTSFSAFRVIPWLGVALGALLPATAIGQEPALRQDLRRNLHENLFLDASVGGQFRSGVYADGALAGPDDKSELRVYLSASANTGEGGPLAAYFGLSGIGRRAVADAGQGDPFASPYDDFEASRSGRVLSAWAEYVLRGDDRAPKLRLRAGRLADFDGSSGLLLFDGLRAAFHPSDRMTISVYGGRRSTLDGDFPDGREDAAVQLVAGAGFLGQFNLLRLELGYRFEEVHRPSVEIGYAISDAIDVGGRAEVLFGGKNQGVPGLGTVAEGDDAPAIRLGVEADLHPNSVSAYFAAFQIQLGRDPRNFGRGGQGPSIEDIQRAAMVPISERRIDRILLGPLESHFTADVSAEYWVLSFLAAHAGAYARVPLGSDKVRSLRPQLLELFAGPDLALAGGIRAGVEARLALENPNDASRDRIFAPDGDGERFYGALRIHAELPYALTETMVIALRPEVEGSQWSSEGPLATLDNQLGGSLAVMGIFRYGSSVRAAVRYGLEVLPEAVREGVDLVHGIEVWLGGSY